MKKLLGFSIFLVFVLIASLTAEAKVTLPAIFSDNMVLQQNTQVNVWGKAAPGEKVTVKASWLDIAVTAKAAANGKWTVKLKTPKATTNQSVTVSGVNEITINNVVIGEVWLCTGQSYMEFPVSRHPDVKWNTGMLNEAEELKDADYPEIRLFHVKHQLAHEGELDDCEGEWLVCNPKNLYDFSAVGFVFGRKLYKELKMPVGLIQSTWGGTHAESWTKLDVMKKNPLYADVLKDFALEGVKQQKNYCKVPATLWNGMIHPILGYTIKGNIWYQGESNSIRADKYQQVFTNMINSWRKEWKQPDMPFYFVQIAPFNYEGADGTSAARLREVQLQNMKDIPNSGMVTTMDVGHPVFIHPVDKETVGNRLAYWALAQTYGMKGFGYAPPVYKSMEIQENKIYINFDHAQRGLSPMWTSLKGFEIAGEDKVFHPAFAEIETKTARLAVSSDKVPHPVAVRYAYKNYVEASIFSIHGIPAAPFRTDNW